MYQSEVYGKGGIYAKVVLASIGNDIPIHTLELRYHRYIHDQFMTHRVFSRNASSSRAIPTKKILEEVRNDPATPIYWGSDKRGMQAGEEVLDPDFCIEKWGYAADEVSFRVEQLCNLVEGKDYGQVVHKEVANRLLDTFKFIKVVVTATEWDNFFKLRLDSHAQPEIQELARCMKEAMDLVEPTKLEVGQWHAPYLNEEEYKFLQNNADKNPYQILVEGARYISAGRCARVSYDNIHSSSDAVTLALSLKKDGHMSPFEHQATPMVIRPHRNKKDGPTIPDSLYDDLEGWLYPGETHVDRGGNIWSGNFRGWIQNRQILE